MASAQDVLNIARSLIGMAENPPRSNETPINDWAGMPYAAWCDMAVHFCFWKADCEELLCDPDKTAFCPTTLAAMRAAGREVPVLQALPGDVIFYSWHNNGVADHIGICEQNLGSGNLVVIEGNTGAGTVARQPRNTSSGYTMYCCRPAYEINIKTEVQVMDSFAVPMPKEGAMNVWSIPNVFGKLGFLSEVRAYFEVHNPNAAPAKVQVWVTLDNGQTIGSPTFEIDLPKWSRKGVDLTGYLGNGGGSLTIKSDQMVACQATMFVK
jgi:hypothetical protein